MANTNYFVQLTREQIVSLTIDVCEMDIDGGHGVIVSENDTAQFLRELGYNQILETGESSIPGIRMATVNRVGNGSVASVAQPVLVPAEVFVKSWDGHKEAEFLDITKRILGHVVAAKLGLKKIELSVPHNSSRPLATSDAFQIFIWSSPKNGGRVTPPRIVFGECDFCPDEGYAASGLGESITDPATGYAVAELVERRGLYIHFDVCHFGRSSELKIYKRILEETVGLLTMNDEEQRLRAEKRIAEQQERSKKAYVEECQKRMAKTIRGTTEGIAQKEREVPELQAKLVRTIRELSGLKDKLAQLEQAKGDRVPAYEAEFENLMKVPGVLDVQAGDGVINVFTEHIYITPDEYPDETYDIGKFRMEINTSGRNGGLRFFNLTRKGKGSGYNIHHPHVESSGQPCLGNIKEMVATLIGEYEYSALAQIGLQYLKSVNLSDGAGQGIRSYWPKIEKEFVNV